MDDKPNIYLDVYGVIVQDADTLANHAEDFIEFLVENFEVYWLTTLCKDGDPTRVIDLIDSISERDISEYLEDIHPTRWNNLKTEVINFDEPFLWFDDNCSQTEKEALKQNNAYEHWAEVDLDVDPDQLQVEIEELAKNYL